MCHKTKTKTNKQTKKKENRTERKGGNGLNTQQKQFEAYISITSGDRKRADSYSCNSYFFLLFLLNCLSVKNQKHNTANNQTITKNKAKKEEKRNKL